MSSTASATSTATHSTASLVDTAANPAFKIVGICLAVGSGLFIGSSFVIKKKGLLMATAKGGNSAGEGHGYLKSWVWWTGMIMMIIGEILNFVAYAFTEAILVTPMGALSVVICAILSHFFLKESLTFFGWIGCVLCIIGATVLALNAPEEQSVTTIEGFKKLFLSPGFLVWASLCIVFALVTVFYIAPRWGKKYMMPYISICSLIGGISVSCTQGLGASIVTSIQGDNQVKNWFFWFLFVFVVITLLVEINYLNKALELFNTSMVVPVYFCFFSTATLITSFILFQGLKASAVTLITMVLGFLTTCLGITLLQMSKVDPKQLSGLDRRSTILLQASKLPTEESEKGEVSALEDPGMDALRGGFGAVGSIIRARSVSRRFSNASSLGTPKRPSYPFQSNYNLSTHGLGDMPRFQLTDTPMPMDAMDQISLHSAKSPTGQPGHQSPFVSPGISRAKSHLKFEEADVVHQYGYTQHDGHTDATHFSRHHLTSLPPLGVNSPSKSGSVPPVARRQASSGESHPVYSLKEEDEETLRKDGKVSIKITGDPLAEEPKEYGEKTLRDFPPRSAPLENTYTSNNPYFDPYRKLNPASQGSTPIAREGSKSALASIFQFASGPDLSLKPRDRDSSRERKNTDDTRGGAHRGVKDYPHLSKKEKDVEHEERAALVSPLLDDEDEDGDGDGDVGAFEDRTTQRSRDYGQSTPPPKQSTARQLPEVPQYRQK